MKKVFFLCLSIFGAAGIHAQSNTVSAGGVATGGGGTVSFTVGQIAYSTSSGNGGSVAQGVQQAYTVTDPTSVLDPSIDLKAKIYPNPTTDQLIITIGTFEYKNLSYQLLDLKGRVLEQNLINSSTTSIDLSKISNGTYFVKIMDKQRQLKTFQVIKNK